MTAHIHAALILQFAKDAAETDKPWERWQCRSNSSEPWTTLTASPRWEASVDYRRKPMTTLLCNGFEIEEPIRTIECLNEHIRNGDVYVADPSNLWFAYAVDKNWLKKMSLQYLARGILYNTKAAAVAHAKAMLGIDPREEELE